jgi:hypothetical protein
MRLMVINWKGFWKNSGSGLFYDTIRTSAWMDWRKLRKPQSRDRWGIISNIYHVSTHFYSGFTGEPESNCHLADPDRKCMTHRQALQLFFSIWVTYCSIKTKKDLQIYTVLKNDGNDVPVTAAFQLVSEGTALRKGSKELKSDTSTRQFARWFPNLIKSLFHASAGSV